MGMSILKSSARGDLFVCVNVETPINLTDKQKELLRQLDLDEASRSIMSFRGKVKKLWDEIKKK